MRPVRIYLFGKMRVDVGDTRLNDLGSAKARELLTYLLLRRRRPYTREKIASVLWQRGTTAQTKAYFRKALWNLQSALSDAGICLVNADADWVELDDAASLWVDVAVFEDACRCVRDCDPATLPADTVDALRNAVDLYVGDLLEDQYQDWCLVERVRLQDAYLRALQVLMGHAEAAGHYDEGIAYGVRLLAVDPAREFAHRRLMRLRYYAGDRTGALRQYRRCAQILDAELGVEPSAATQDVRTRIQSDTLSGPSRRGPSSDAAPRMSARPILATAAPHSITEGLARIRQLQHQLADAHARIEEELEAVKGVLQQK